MIETRPALPERVGMHGSLSALHDTLQTVFVDSANPTESLAAQREQFATVVAIAQEQQLDERGRTLIDHYKTVVDFMWFGGHSDTLPAAVGCYGEDSPRGETWRHIRLKEDIISSEIFGAITHTLMPLGLGDLLLERTAYAEQNQAKTDAAFKRLVDATPAAQWFEAFNVGMPRAEMRFSAIERAARETAIQQAAHRRFGPSEHMPNRPHPAARRQISQQTLLLDDETTLRPRPQSNSDLALMGFMRHVEAGLARYRANSAPVARQEYEPETGWLNEFDAANQQVGKYDMSAVAYDVVGESNLPLGITHDVEEMSVEFYLDTFGRAFAGMPSHKAVYENALLEARKRYLEYVVGGLNLVRAREVSTALSFLKLVSPDHPLDEEPRSGAAKNQYTPDKRIETVEHPTSEGEERERRMLIGTIEKYNDPIPDAIRLLQQSRYEVSLPLLPPDEHEADLVIALRNFTGDPYVPGYELIAANRLQHRYYFAYLPDTDPYKPNNTLISAEAKESLAAQYKQAGLYSLANDIRHSSDLTISGLADLSQQHSTYTYRPPLRPDFSSSLIDISSFSLFTSEERLRGTCGIYSKFGQFCVGEVLPPERVYVTGGYCISGGSDKISGIKHAQLSITAENSYDVTSITEWTAAAADNPSCAYVGGVHGNRGISDHISPSVPSRGSAPRSLLTVKEQVNASTRQLLMQLGIVFAPEVAEAIPDDYIYTKVRALGERHPIAKTLGVLLRAADALENSEELAPQHIAEHMGVIAVIADMRRRDRGGATHSQLDMLEAALVPIVRLQGADVSFLAD